MAYAREIRKAWMRPTGTILVALVLFGSGCGSTETRDDDALHQSKILSYSELTLAST